MDKKANLVEVNFDMGVMYAEKLTYQYPDKIYDRGGKEHEPTAIKYMEMAAQEGHLEAQYRLGDLYNRKHRWSHHSAPGWHEQNDDDKKLAIKWFEKAAKQGHPKAQYELGVLLFNSKKKSGVEWLRKAAEQSHAEANAWLGDYYYAHKEMPKKRKCVEHYIAAAESNSNKYDVQNARKQLAILYYEGEFIEQDYEKAYHLFEESRLDFNEEYRNLIRIKFKHGLSDFDPDKR